VVDNVVKSMVKISRDCKVLTFVGDKVRCVAEKIRAEIEVVSTPIDDDGSVE
jgi:hypothetical protein